MFTKLNAVLFQQRSTSLGCLPWADFDIVLFAFFPLGLQGCANQDLRKFFVFFFFFFAHYKRSKFWVRS